MKTQLFRDVAVACALIACSSSTPATQDGGGGPFPTQDAAALTNEFDVRTNMRAAWQDDVIWTRMYVIAAIAHHRDAPVTLERLHLSQDRVADVVRPLWGDALANQLASLLHVQAENIVAITSATLSQNLALLGVTKVAAYANADKIAQLLADQKVWSESDATAQTHAMLAPAIAEIEARASSDWNADVAAADAAFSQSAAFSDFLTAGLVQELGDQISHSPLSPQDETVQVTMRLLWVQRALWMSDYVVVQASALPDANVAASRLMRSHGDISAALVRFYGDSFASRLTTLLDQYATDSFPVLAALQSGNPDAVITPKIRWYASGDAVAQLLATVNPFWTLATVQSSFRTDADETFDLMKARLDRTSTNDVAPIDAMMTNVVTLSAFLSTGIAAQFPYNVP